MRPLIKLKFFKRLINIGRTCTGTLYRPLHFTPGCVPTSTKEPVEVRVRRSAREFIVQNLIVLFFLSLDVLTLPNVQRAPFQRERRFSKGGI